MKHDFVQKRICAMLLCLCMLLSAFPLPALAVNAETDGYADSVEADTSGVETDAYADSARTDTVPEEDTAELFAVVEDPDGYPEEAFLFDADANDVEALKAYFHEQIWNAARSIPVNGGDYPSMSLEEIKKALSSMHYEPDMFLFSGGYSYRYSESNYTFYPNYNGEILAEYEEAKALYSRELARILSTVDPNWSELETALYLNDYVAVHYTYDFDAIGQPGANHDAYSMLRDGYGVCEAYSNLMIALLNGAGMEASYVMSSSMHHMWNIVRVDGQWYHVDTTWNDATKNRDRKGYFIGYPGYAGHDYFLLSTLAMKSVNNGSHYHSNDWVYGVDVVCDANRYDQAAWKSAGKSSFISVNRKWYCVASNGLYIMDLFDRGREQRVLSFADICEELYSQYTWNDIGNYAGISGIVLWNGQLYFNTFYQILRYNPNEKTYAVLQDIGLSNGFISGCGELDGQLVYLYHPQNGNRYELYSIDLPEAEKTPTPVITLGSIEAKINDRVFLPLHILAEDTITGFTFYLRYNWQTFKNVSFDISDNLPIDYTEIAPGLLRITCEGAAIPGGNIGTLVLSFVQSASDGRNVIEVLDGSDNADYAPIVEINGLVNPKVATVSATVTLSEAHNSRFVADVSLRSAAGERVTLKDLNSGAAFKPEISVMEKPQELRTANVFLAVYDHQRRLADLQQWELDLVNPLPFIQTRTIAEGVEAAFVKIIILDVNTIPLTDVQILES